MGDGASNSTKRLSPALKASVKGMQGGLWIQLEELEAAIELYKEHEEEDTPYTHHHSTGTGRLTSVMPATGRNSTTRLHVVEELKLKN